MLKSSILKTLTYFDLHHQPLTLVELNRFLLIDGPKTTVSPSEIFSQLEILKTEGLIGEENGFFFLNGRAEIVTRRRLNYPFYLQRVFRTARLIQFFKYIPFIRSIIISGSTAGMYGQAASDIDFFVIVKPGRIWLARIFLTGVTHVLGIRRYGSKVTNRICLNHYLVEGYSPEIKYRPLDYAVMLVLLNPEPARKLLNQQDWLGEQLFNPPEIATSVLTQGKSTILQPVLELVFEILGAIFWNQLACLYQKNRIKPGPGILVGDQELAFHPSDKWQLMMAELTARTPS